MARPYLRDSVAYPLLVRVNWLMSLGRVMAIECLTGVGVLLTAAFAKGYIYIRENPGQLSSVLRLEGLIIILRPSSSTICRFA